jgi:RNA-directed DNA polymerase
MTVQKTGATAHADHTGLDWETFDWDRAAASVRKLQARIVKAVQAGKWRRAYALQHLLTHSLSGKMLAVARVTRNKGRNTPGVDGQTWQTKLSKQTAVKELNRRGYQPQPLRRVLIPKSNGKMRPLGIPTMKDRAMQALYLLGLDPIAETRADPDSYGFRKTRSCADAIGQCFIALGRSVAPKWILEADIKACFDKIDHDWLMGHVPIADKAILRMWLKAGYLHQRAFFDTIEGTPQGGIISPTLANVALDGLQTALTPWMKKNVPAGQGAAVNLIRYADDFVITARSKELLENEIHPTVERFLARRGLSLSQEKTSITHIADGFDFLGQTVRSFDGKLIIQPSKRSIKAFLNKLRSVVKANKAASAYNLVMQLNPKLRGWANYHRHVCSKKTFAQIDSAVFRTLWQWARRRHSDKSRHWVADKYFGTLGGRRWRFFGETRTAKGAPMTRNWLGLAAHTRIVRHVKIRKDANPYDPADAAYFANRKRMQQQGRVAAAPANDYDLKDDLVELERFLNSNNRARTTAPPPANRGV